MDNELAGGFEIECLFLVAMALSVDVRVSFCLRLAWATSRIVTMSSDCTPCRVMLLYVRSANA